MAAAWLALHSSAPGCSPPIFQCETDDACTAAGLEGFCESSGYCSFADPSCESERRYGGHSLHTLADQCVPSDDDGSSDTTAGEPVASDGITLTTGPSDDPTGGETATSTLIVWGDSAGLDVGTMPGCPIVFDDDFEDGALDRSWELSLDGTYGEVFEADGLVTVTVPATMDAWTSIGRPLGPFAERSVMIELAESPGEPDAYAYLNVASMDKYEFAVFDGNLELWVAIADTEWDLIGFVPFAPDTHRFLRLRASAEQVFYEVSAEGEDWTVLGSVEGGSLGDEHRVTFGIGTWILLETGTQVSIDRLHVCG
jgi:hypothetical protein